MLLTTSFPELHQVERIVGELYRDHDYHRRTHPQHRGGTCQDPRPHPHDLARRLLEKLNAEEAPHD